MKVLSVSGVETINDTTFKRNVYFYKEKIGVIGIGLRNFFYHIRFIIFENYMDYKNNKLSTLK